MSFVHLHNHATEGSVLDATQKVDDMVIRAKEIGQSAIALTDHGTMSGAIKLLKACKKQGIKPIIGNEMYILVDNKKYHLTVLAKNLEGYKTLCRITNYSHIHGWHGNKLFGRPCITRKFLEENHTGLIVLSGCVAGEIPRYILSDEIYKARETAIWFKNLFGEDYYLEIQDHGFRGEKTNLEGDKESESKFKKPPLNDVIINQQLHQFSRELDIKLVATNDSHFGCAEDWEAQTALLCINTKSKISNPKMRYTGTEYLKTESEMLSLFTDHLPQDVVNDAIAVSQEIADKVEGYEGLILAEGDTSRMPKFNLPEGVDIDSEQYLRNVTHNGLIERFKGGEVPKNYLDRLETELDVICSKNFADYFLVVWDYCKYCRDSAISIGAGRGSAAGSLVAYSLRITNVDPVHHGLLFERFLNPERTSMPDVDIDFEPTKRQDVVQYVTRKYGNVCQIGTFGTLSPKSALKDVFRVSDLPYEESDRLSKMIPVVRGKPTSLKVMISDSSPVPEFREEYLNNPSYKKAIDMAISLDGVTKSRGVHAAGVVISPINLDEIVPVMRATGENGDISIISQYEMADIEALGLLKMDFLGLKNLTAIDKTLASLRNRGINISSDEIITKDRSFDLSIKSLPEDVEKGFRMLSKGKTYGVFQLGNKGIADKVKRLNPDSIEGISAISALYRPGPLDAGVVDDYISRKLGEVPISYPLPELESILNTTYGCMIYQEQIMKIAQVMAGYSLGEADLLRRAMGKKKPAEMAKQRDRFISGSLAAGFQKESADEIFDAMSKYAEYCFNASHSIAYSYISWITAYLKANYPGDFMASLLSCESFNFDELKKCIHAAKEIGIQVLPPDINKSDIDFKRVSDTSVMFGLSAIKGLGVEIVEKIIEEREKGSFTDFGDLVSRISLTKRSTDGLILSGALDSFAEGNRNTLISNSNIFLEWSKSLLKDKKSNQISLFDITPSKFKVNPPKIKHTEDFDLDYKSSQEEEFLGVCLGRKYDFENINLVSGFCNENIDSVIYLEDEKNIVLLCVIKELRFSSVKSGANKGKSIAFAVLEDNSNTIDAVIFPNAFSIYRSKLLAKTTLLVRGVISTRNGNRQIIVNGVFDPVEKDLDFAMAYVEDSEVDKEKIKSAIAFSRGDLPLLIWYRGNTIRTDEWINNQGMEQIKNSGISVVKTPSKNIGFYLKIFDAVDMLQKAKKWETVQELSECFNLISEDFGATVWKHSPRNTKIHVNNLKKESVMTK